MPKWLKYALLVLGPLALVIGIVMSTGKKSAVPDRYTFADITTGKIITMHKSEFASIPVKNKEGKRVLFPAIKAEDGGYVLNDRYREALTWVLDQKVVTKEQLKVDVTTLKVLNPS